MRDDVDPRSNEDFYRELPGSGRRKDAVLVGVVHDHPASAYRVKSIVESVDPDVVGVELPPLALPLYERYADVGETPPTFGGELSTAIQATNGEVVGIDGPSLRFLGRLGRTLYREDVTRSTVSKVLESVGTVTRNAIDCRIAATRMKWSDSQFRVGSPVDHDCEWGDDPREQARDEREQFRRARAVASALGTPEAVRLRETIREDHMAARLETLRRESTVVAVVGLGHLDPLAERLSGTD